MNEPLRPSTLGEILDRTAQLYRGNFLLFAGTAALPLLCTFALAIPAGVLFAVPGIAAGGAGSVVMIRGLAFILAFLIVTPLYLAIYVFSIGGITQAAVSVHGGQKLTIRAALAGVRPRFWTYLRLLVLQTILVAGVPAAIASIVLAPFIYLAFRSGAGAAASFAFGFLAFLLIAAALVAIVWLALRYAMGMAVCVAEKKTAWESLQRADKLSKGTRGRIFVLYLLIGALSIAVSMLSYFILLVVTAAASVAGKGSVAAIVGMALGAILYFVVNIASQIVLAPVPWIALVLFYYDQRIRKEGFDIEWMMEQAGLVAQAPAAPTPGAESNLPLPVAPPDTVEEP